MTAKDLKRKEFKRTVRANMIASLRLEGVIVKPSIKSKSVAELKAKYARQVRC